MVVLQAAHRRRGVTDWALAVTAATAMGLLLCGFCLDARAQTSDGPNAKRLNAQSLKVNNLNYERELTALYLGDLPNAGLEPNSGIFVTLFPLYVNAFARYCDAYLPDNRVEIMKQECARESTPVNIYGNPVGATTCVEYRPVGTGLYAKPELLGISEQLQSIQGRQLIGDFFNRSDDPMASSRKMTDVMLLAGDDMNQLFRANSCNSKALERLEDNMVHIARGTEPLRLKSGDTLADVKARAPKRDPAKPADYARLIDDLIFENSRGWMLNQYTKGSVRDVNVERRDAQGRPSLIRASYGYSQLGQPAGGSVKLTFQQGLPKCLYFFDAPSTCRVASPRIANAYERGEY